MSIVYYIRPAKHQTDRVVEVLIQKHQLEKAGLYQKMFFHKDFWTARGQICMDRIFQQKSGSSCRLKEFLLRKVLQVVGNRKPWQHLKQKRDQDAFTRRLRYFEGLLHDISRFRTYLYLCSIFIYRTFRLFHSILVPGIFYQSTA